MVEGSSAHGHGLKMISLIEKLSNMNVVMDNNLYVNLILQSLSIFFDQVIMNFNMSKTEVMIKELINMLGTKKVKEEEFFSKKEATDESLRWNQEKGKGSQLQVLLLWQTWSLEMELQSLPWVA
ncbi:hypothetical protein CDL12_05482 [Handroanthus impetiginosus]|uniref:Uncharacterized protein n=1 Tax=Handroanthus impetiginosus TaxID=429701 RepID=A0A2G9HWB4_9LAMI|nr:hypothetical protein CDL12_05482 [Handroanthus impetiginosus]